MESESHAHDPIRRKDAMPVPHPKDDELALSGDGPQHEDVAGWKGSRATDENGRHIGKVEAVVDVGGAPEWIVVKHHSHHVLAPVAGAIGGGGGVFLPHEAEKIEAAPGIESHDDVSENAIRAARTYYGFG